MIQLTREEVQSLAQALLAAHYSTAHMDAIELLQSKLAEKDDGEPVAYLIRMWMAKAYEGGCVNGNQSAVEAKAAKFIDAHTKSWVGLTDEEVVACYDQVYGFNMQWGAFYKVIEAKLKEKNT